MKSYFSIIVMAGGCYNLESIINRWAPPADGNDTHAYIRSVIRLTDGRITGRKPLPQPNTEQGKIIFTDIIRAMTCVECGIGWDEVDVPMIEKGWKQAFR